MGWVSRLFIVAMSCLTLQAQNAPQDDRALREFIDKIEIPRTPQEQAQDSWEANPQYIEAERQRQHETTMLYIACGSAVLVAGFIAYGLKRRKPA